MVIALGRQTDLLIDIDRETFKTMWEMSAPGGPAEGCFLRITEEELYCQERAQPNPLEVMPDVSKSVVFY